MIEKSCLEVVIFETARRYDRMTKAPTLRSGLVIDFDQVRTEIREHLVLSNTKQLANSAASNQITRSSLCSSVDGLKELRHRLGYSRRPGLLKTCENYQACCKNQQIFFYLSDWTGLEERITIDEHDNIAMALHRYMKQQHPGKPWRCEFSQQLLDDI